MGLREDILEYIDSNGFTLEKMELRNRNGYAYISVGSDNFFLKISARPESDLSIMNEYEYNDAVQIHSMKEQLPFTAPWMIELGKIGERSFYISESVPDSCMKSAMDNLDACVSSIVDYLIWLRQITITLPRNAGSCIPPKEGAAYAQAMLDIYEPLLEHRIDPLRKIVVNASLEGRTLAHCDVKPWHCYFEDGRIGIVDSEFATTGMVEHFDVAHCYGKIFTEMKDPELADDLLSIYYGEMIRINKSPSWLEEEFKPVLAVVSVMCYGDAARRKEAGPYHESLITQVVKRRF